MRAAVDSFAPAAIDAAVTERGSLLKGRAVYQMEKVAERHADLARNSSMEPATASLDRAFVAAYDAAESGMTRR